VQQVQAAHTGALAVLQVCLDESEQNYSKAERDLNAAVTGVRGLDEALAQDPDTPYENPEDHRAESMRHLAAFVVSGGRHGGGCEGLQEEVQTTMNGLPR
jgi:hypothetical protein